MDRCLVIERKHYSSKIPMSHTTMLSYLWYEPIWHRETEDARNECGTAKEKKIPMETTRLLQGKLASLGRDAAHILCNV